MDLQVGPDARETAGARHEQVTRRERGGNLLPQRASTAGGEADHPGSLSGLSTQSDVWQIARPHQYDFGRNCHGGRGRTWSVLVREVAVADLAIILKELCSSVEWI